MFSGGGDNTGRMLDLATGQSTQIAQHDGPVKTVKWIDTPGAGILATGSWDKTIKVLGPVYSRAPRSYCYAIVRSIGTSAQLPQ